METILNRLLAVERLLKRILDQFRKLAPWQRWAEQRIRELGQRSNLPSVGEVMGTTGERHPLRKAMTGSSGISAATSQTQPTGGTVTLYAWDPDNSEWVATTDTTTAFNPSPAGGVAGDTLVTIGWVDNAMWEVILEPCP